THDALDNDINTVRQCSEWYNALIVNGDKSGLNNMFHPQYIGLRLPSGIVTDKADIKTSIWCWMEMGRFIELETPIDSIRIFGPTAIESGTFSGIRQGNGIYHQLPYTRIWVKDRASWKLIHEHYH